MQIRWAIVLGVKNNERHRLEGAEKIKWKIQVSQKLCGQIESCQITTSQGRGASIGDRLALDDSAIDGHTKMEISAKGGNAAPSVSIVEETSITQRWCDQAEEPWNGVNRSNEH